MAEKQAKSSTLTLGRLYGTVVRSTIEAGAVLRTSLPDLDSRFVAVTTKDIPDTNTIDLFEDSFELLSSTKISYLGQPILALFGPDVESVEVKSRQIEVEYQLSGNEREGSPTKMKLREHRWGDLAAVASRSASTLERAYVERQSQSHPNQIESIRCQVQDGVISIEMATQWPYLVREIVAKVCVKRLQDVIITPLPYYTKHNEYLVESALLAALAAVAANKSNRAVQLNNCYPKNRGATHITRKTFLSEEGRPLGEEILVRVNLGGKTLFSDEIFNQMKAALIPLYPLEACSIRFEALSSSQPPMAYFSDLGYSTALFSTEAHASAMAREEQVSPANWRNKYYEESSQLTDIVSLQPLSQLKDLIDLVCTASDFSRHNAVYDLQRRTRKGLSTFLSYTRGIGLASAAGVSGLSAQFPSLDSFTLSLTLDTNDRVIVNSSHTLDAETRLIWQQLIVKELGVDVAEISIAEGSTRELLDSGPTLLGEELERAGIMIYNCCQTIKRRRFNDPLPITTTASGRSAMPTEHRLFASSGWGAMVLELEINTIDLVVEVRHIWCSLSFSMVKNSASLKAACHKTIVRTLNECNALLPYNSEKGSQIELMIEPGGEHELPSSIHQALRGMVMASLSSALSQALNQDFSTLPVIADDIISSLRISE